MKEQCPNCGIYCDCTCEDNAKENDPGIFSLTFPVLFIVAPLIVIIAGIKFILS